MHLNHHKMLHRANSEPFPCMPGIIEEHEEESVRILNGASKTVSILLFPDPDQVVTLGIQETRRLQARQGVDCDTQRCVLWPRWR